MLKNQQFKQFFWCISENCREEGLKSEVFSEGEDVGLVLTGVGDTVHVLFDKENAQASYGSVLS